MKFDYMINEILDIFDKEDDFSKIEDLKKKLPGLCDNNLACVLEDDTDVFYSNYPNLYRFASYYFCKHNKEYKSYIRPLSKYEFGGKDNSRSSDNKELLKLARYSLYPGNYLLKLKKDNYMYLNIKYKSDTDFYYYSSKLYIIGKKWLKYRDMFNQEWETYKELTEDKDTAYIYNTGKPPVNTIFKSFNEFVYKDKENILDYIDNWYNSIPQYHKFGMIPKLSILLYGEPGTGKSTFAKAVAKRFNINSITILSQNDFNITEKNNSNRSYGRATVFLIDDIDCISYSRENMSNEDKLQNSMLLSNLLAFLDNPPSFNITAKDGLQYLCSIVIATTNYYDKLDEAVKRYGRFDKKIKMDKLDKIEAEEMCNLYKLSLEDLSYNYKDIRDFINSKNGRISPAYLQSICLENIDNELKNN